MPAPKESLRDFFAVKCQMSNVSFGFTLIEVILVIGMLAVVASMSTAVYFGFYKGTLLDEARQDIANNLVLARARATQGESNLKWGIRFNNVSGDPNDKYEIFMTSNNYASGTAKETFYLPSQVEFSDPADGGVKDIIFNRVSGTVSSPASVSVISSGTSDSRTVSVNSQGLIY